MEKERAARQRAQRDKEVAARNDAAIQNTGKLLAKSALNKAVNAREKEIKNKSRMVRMGLALVVVLVAVFWSSKLTAGGFDYEDIQPLHDNDNGHPGLIKHFALACAALLAVPSYHLYSNLPPSCHEVKSLDDLYDYLHKVGNWDLLCSRLGVDEGIIAEIREDSQASKKLYNCLKAFVDLGEPYSCWEKVVSTVCGPGFGKKKLGKTISTDLGIALPSECT